MSAEMIQDEPIELYPCGHPRIKENTYTAINGEHGTERTRCKICKGKRNSNYKRPRLSTEELAARKRERSAERWEDIDYMRKYGAKWIDVAARLGISYEALNRWMAANPRASQ